MDTSNREAAAVANIMSQLKSVDKYAPFASGDLVQFATPYDAFLCECSFDEIYKVIKTIPLDPRLYAHRQGVHLEGVIEEASALPRLISAVHLVHA